MERKGKKRTPERDETMERQTWRREGDERAAFRFDDGRRLRERERERRGSRRVRARSRCVITLRMIPSNSIESEALSRILMPRLDLVEYASRIIEISSTTSTLHSLHLCCACLLPHAFAASVSALPSPRPTPAKLHSRGRLRQAARDESRQGKERKGEHERELTRAQVSSIRLRALCPVSPVPVPVPSLSVLSLTYAVCFLLC